MNTLTSLPENDADRTVPPDVTAHFERDVMPLLESLLRHAMRVTGNQADAEDLLQDTLMKAYAAWPNLWQGSNINAWLHRILVNAYINGYRKARRRPALTLYPPGDFADQYLMAARNSPSELSSAEDEALNALPDNQIKAAMQALPDQFRAAIYYADIEGFRCKEIAEIMNTPVGTVLSRFHRGRRILRGLLADVAEERGYGVVCHRGQSALSTCGI